METRKRTILFTLACALLLIFSFYFFILTVPSADRVGLETLDNSIALRVEEIQNPSLTKYALFFTYLGNWQIILSAQIVILLVFFITHKRYLITLFLSAIVAGELAATLFKELAGRTRPEFDFYNLAPFGNSFPSGHALLSIVFYGLLTYLALRIFERYWQRISIVMASIIGIGGIGLSRIYLGVHWFSDVVGGWLLGGSLLCLALWLFYHFESAHEGDSRSLYMSRRELIVIIAAAALLEGFFVYYFYTAELSRIVL